MESENSGDACPEPAEQVESVAVRVERATSLIQLTRGAVTTIAFSIAMAFLAMAIALIIVNSAWHADRGVSVCRSDLLAAVDVTKAPILLHEGFLLVYIADAVVNHVDRHAEITTEAAAYLAAAPAYQKAIDDRNRTNEICGK